MHNNIENCKSQPSQLIPLYNNNNENINNSSGNSQIIDTTHLVISSTSSNTSNITTLPMQFNHQGNMNVKTLSANIWQQQQNNDKTGNNGDPNSPPMYIQHKQQHARACTNTYQIMETETLKNEKVTQPTMSMNIERRGSKTLRKTLKQEAMMLLNGSSNTIATKQISHDLNSNENTFLSCSEFENKDILVNENSHDDRNEINQHNEYRLIHLLNRNMIGADECKIYQYDKNNLINNNKNINKNNNKGIDNVEQMASLSLLNQHHNNYHHNLHPQMPSSSQLQHQKQNQFVQSQKCNPVSLTNKIIASNLMDASDAETSSAKLKFNVPCTSSVLSATKEASIANDINCINTNENDEYQMTITETSVATAASNKLKTCANNSNDIKNNSVNVQNESHIKQNMNCVNVECYINDKSNNNNNNNNTNCNNSKSVDNELKNNSNQTTINATTTASTDNLVITSAIENLSSAHATPNKTAKYSNDIITVREKRRRDRRDRRLARTRTLNGNSATTDILPDILNRPPPYSSLPPQSVIPSIISTVPVNDTRYIFSLPLVRR